MTNYKKILAVIGLFFFLLSCQEKDNQYPVVSWKGNKEQPLIFYISGDAGFNTFSKSFGENMQNLGYDIDALNTKKYFWDGRTPNQTAKDANDFLLKTIKSRQDKNIIIVGFSYGADVLPFIYNRLSPEVKTQVKKIAMIGPSKSNDFKIHLTDYIGNPNNTGYPVIPEINKTGTVPLLIILSDFEFKYFPYKQVSRHNNYEMKHLAGDHHFGGNTKMLADTINYFIQH